MIQPTYILQTPSGGRALAFDSLDRAKAEAKRRFTLHGTRFQIIEQTIQERIVQS